MRLSRLVPFALLALAVAAPTVRASPSGPPMELPDGSLVAIPPVPAKDQGGLVGAVARGDLSSYRATLSGTLLRAGAAPTSTWLLYPNACNERAAGTWSPRTSPVADSMDTYDPLTQNHGYGLYDYSQKEILWHVTDGSDSPDVGAGLIIAGSRSLWCGKYDANWIVKSGYPNLTYQILYLDTDLNALGGGSARSAPYALSWQECVSTEQSYDYLYLVGGGEGATNRDPIGSNRIRLDKVVANGSDGDAELLVVQTGSMITSEALTYVEHGQVFTGSGWGEAAVTSWSLSGIPARHRGVYFVFTADCLYSGEDGLWPWGHGQVLDNITASDQPGGVGNLYGEQVPAGGTDPYWGAILVAVSGQFSVCARVSPGVGTVWTIQAGDNLPTADYCSPQRQRASDRMFLGADATSKLTIPSSDAAIVSCPVPVPPGTGAVLGYWDQYFDMPRGSGFVEETTARVFKDGAWGNWVEHPTGMVYAGEFGAWLHMGSEIVHAAQADSVQLRIKIQCIPFFAVDHQNCQPVWYGALVDDIYLQAVSGVPAPKFEVLYYTLPQSTFVDGTDPASVGCLPATIAAGRCWPGPLGSDAGGYERVNDNLNTVAGDNLRIVLLSAFDQDGMGINWKYGFSGTILQGERISLLNATSYNPAFDTPRWIYRIFDPATLTWSPWDSSALFADNAAISGTDTLLIDTKFRFDWPPYDKYYVNTGGADIFPNVDVALPGAPGWTLNGWAKYSQVPFLPRGAKLQYYFKAVDIRGGAAYYFGKANEVEDLPILPGGSVRAPDIVTFSVLPSVYPPGAAGTLLADRTDTRVLNLDSKYMGYGSGAYDPITQALRGLGVRADRYREHGSAIGGHRAGWTGVFPNWEDYSIKTLLAESYNIIIDNLDWGSEGGYTEADAVLLRQWWSTDTGPDAGDRCIMNAGEGLFNSLLNASRVSLPNTERVVLAQEVYGVGSAVDAWTGTGSNQYPTIDDRFAGGGPGLAAPGTYTYPVDGGCPDRHRFDGLTKVASSEAQNAVIYPGGVPEVAGIARMSELDAPNPGEGDRSKALCYAFSLASVRTAGIPKSASNYVTSGVENRMKILYKFLTSCRQNTQVVTAPCWPCPSNPAEMTANWATASGFQTGTYGTLFPIQDYTQATGVVVGPSPKVNRLEGNFPNPFNPETAIRFQAATPGKVTVRIFDVAGRLVNTLTKNVTETGLNEIRWNGKSTDGRSMASGVYFYRIRFANGQESEAKMTMLK